VTEVVSYCAVDDIGVVINHAIAEGQLHGGIIQGAGQVFGEQITYDPDTGQSLTATFMDYYMPRAGLISEVRGEEHPTKSTVSPLWVKGVGESGCTASIPVLVAAVTDAVRPLGGQNPGHAANASEGVAGDQQPNALTSLQARPTRAVAIRVPSSAHWRRRNRVAHPFDDRSCHGMRLP